MFIYRRINFSFVDTTFVADLLRNFSQVRKIFMGSARNGCRRCVVTLTHVWRGKSRLHLVGVMPCLTIEKRTFPLSSLVETCVFARLALSSRAIRKVELFPIPFYEILDYSWRWRAENSRIVFHQRNRGKRKRNWRINKKILGISW